MPAASPGRGRCGVMDADLGRGAVGLLVPFVGDGEEVAVGVTQGDVGEHGGGQGAAVVQLLAALFDFAFVGERAQHLFEFGAQCVLQPEGAGDLFGAGLARLLPDEGEDVGLGRKGGGGFSSGFGQ